MIIASNRPIPEMTAQSLEAYIKSRLPANILAQELAAFGPQKFAALLDRPRLDWDNSPVIVTDNHPIVEYPDVARTLVTE